MNIAEIHSLPFVSMSIIYKGKELKLQKVLLDTGSASTLLNADIVREIGIVPAGDDEVETIRGVGGVEYVYTKYMDAVIVDGAMLKCFKVEVGSMDYGMEIDGILGFDFLKLARATINVGVMKLTV
ncbi:retropepsin-like aspartic protease [Paenibacillus medicaginis]|uniref:Retropepsin-like aspartic protease n=1 Tax=Paenibacillus medicaginis TaxID=1470560 RepID=A0ABV5C3A2_9BACL